VISALGIDSNQRFPGRLSGGGLENRRFRPHGPRLFVSSHSWLSNVPPNLLLAKAKSDGINWWVMTTEHSAQESPLSAKILLPFCYHFWHTLVRLETKVGESVLKSPSLKWKKKQGLPQFCWLFESGLV
jgi:hypothetical protein